MPEAWGLAEIEISRPARHLRKVVHVASNVARPSGSTYTMVPRLCALLRAEGLDVTLLSADEPADALRTGLRNGFPVRCFSKAWPGSAIGRSPAFNAEVEHLGRSADVFHVHGMWRRSGVEALHRAKRARVPAIVSPMGLFSPAALAIAKLRKRVYWDLLQEPAMEAVACYHATSGLEHDDMRRFGIRAPIAVVPPGIDIPRHLCPIPATVEKTLLFLGRITPIKNLQSLILAWRSLQDEYPIARLQIAGPDDRGHALKLASYAEQIGTRQLSIEPGLWGKAKEAAIQSSHALVLPSLSESFGLVVAEALAMGRPVITTTGSPWRVVHEARCGWWVDSGPDALAGSLREVLAMNPSELAAMGIRGRNFALRELSWSKSIPRLIELYDWLIFKGTRPSFVSV